jgi:hypothetical protein
MKTEGEREEEEEEEDEEASSWYLRSERVTLRNVKGGLVQANNHKHCQNFILNFKYLKKGITYLQ